MARRPHENVDDASNLGPPHNEVFSVRRDGLEHVSFSTRLLTLLFWHFSLVFFYCLFPSWYFL